MKLTLNLFAHTSHKGLLEHGRTPLEQVGLVKNTTFTNNETIISCSPYIMKALVKKYKDAEIIFKVKGEIVSREAFWYQFTEPKIQMLKW